MYIHINMYVYIYICLLKEITKHNLWQLSEKNLFRKNYSLAPWNYNSSTFCNALRYTC